MMRYIALFGLLFFMIGCKGQDKIVFEFTYENFDK